MNFFDRIDALYKKPDITYTVKSDEKLVFFSDTHCGDGGLSDDCYPNKQLLLKILRFYMAQGFVIIGVGDIEEQWQSKEIDIQMEYFEHLALFKYRLGGNHDREQNYPEAMLIKFSQMVPVKTCRGENFCLPVPNEMLVLHGHQGVDYLNDKLWWVGRFFTRYVWRPLEYLGIRDWTSASKNLKRHDLVRSLHLEWASRHPDVLLGCGHLHKLENVGNYWNFGSSTNVGQIDCVELTDKLSMVRWTPNGRMVI